MAKLICVISFALIIFAMKLDVGEWIILGADLNDQIIIIIM